MTLRPQFMKDYGKGAVNKFDFYSGSQITVWIGDILIDDIAAIQWNRTQNKRPIYGYASQQFDAVAKGTVLIQGNFTINFRQRGYLSAIMDSIKYLYRTLSPGTDAEDKHIFQSQTWPQLRRIIGLHLKNDTFGPTTVQEMKNLGESENFLEEVKLYEDLIWGEEVPPDRATAVNNEFQKRVNAPDVQQSINMPDGFNILITYGNLSSTEARTLRDQLQSTSKSLTGVHLIGESQALQVGGQPVMEQYDFMARDTDTYIGTTR